MKAVNKIKVRLFKKHNNRVVEILSVVRKGANIEVTYKYGIEVKTKSVTRREYMDNFICIAG